MLFKLDFCTRKTTVIFFAQFKKICNKYRVVSSLSKLPKSLCKSATRTWHVSIYFFPVLVVYKGLIHFSFCTKKYFQRLILKTYCHDSL